MTATQAPTPGPLSREDYRSYVDEIDARTGHPTSYSLAPTAPVEASGSGRRYDSIREAEDRELFSPASSPQPSGETRELVAYFGTYRPHVADGAAVTVYVPLTLQQIDAAIGSLTTPARAEAQDEGAGEVVTALLEAAGFYEAAGLPITAERLRGLAERHSAHPSPTPAADADRVRIAVEALEAERAWHERVADFAFDDAREASEREEETSERDAMRRMNVHNERVSIIGAALATLKSEGK